MSAAAATEPSPATGSLDPGGRAYFPELDGLRFWAFLLVFAFHGGIPGPELAALLGRDLALAIRSNGWAGVQLFFVLSGYLITTLLLREERRYGRIDLRAFWVRRILRIWPLYYLIVAIGFGLLPLLSGSFGSEGHRVMVRVHLVPFLTFLGNWSMALQGPIAIDALGVLWSVCVEEQFYIVCPLLVAFVGARWRIPIVAAAATGSALFRWWLAGDGSSDIQIQFNTLSQVDTLFSGVLLALLLGPEIPQSRAWKLAGRIGQYPAVVGLLYLLASPALGRRTPSAWAWDYVAFWLAAAGVVGSAVLCDGWLRRSLSGPRLVTLGRISYGLYMYHELALALRPTLAVVLGGFPNDAAAVTVAALGLNVVGAAYSYRAFERPFLNRKLAWTRVESRPI